MSALIVIPARLGSTRLPRKPLQLLAGRPLIVRVVERVATVCAGATVVVATDSPEVASAVKAAGGAVALTRPDHPSGTDRVAEVAAMPEFRGRQVIVNVQGDEPFVSRETIEAAIAQVQEAGHPIGTVASPDDPAILAHPSVVKVVRDAAGRALYFSRAPIPFLRDDVNAGVRDALVLRHLGIYAYRRDVLERWVALPPGRLETVEQLEQLRPLEAGMSIGVGVSTAVAAGGIDTEDDLRRANASWPEPSFPVLSPVIAGTR